MQLCLINTPELPGMVSDKDKAGGIGVAKPFQASWRNPYLPPTPPQDWLYAVAIAEKAGVPTVALDAIGHRWDDDALLSRVHVLDASHIGIRVSMPSLDNDLALANTIKRRHPAAKVFIYGHATQTTFDKWRSRCEADAVFFGEVEGLLEHYLQGHAHSHIIDPKSDAKTPCDWAYVQDLDAIPFPAWHAIDIKHYSPTGKAEDFVFYLLTSRGCPKGCSMCPYYVHQGKQWRFRSLDNVMAEVSYLRTLGAYRVQTRDPNISWRKPRLLELAARLAQEPLLHISTETDLEALNENDLIALRAGGFKRIMTGVESVDESILKDIHQNGNALKRVLDNMAVCERLGIEVTGFFIVGSLSETWQSVRSTVNTARALPCTYSVSLMTPYFGTKLRESFVQAGYTREADFKQYNGYTSMIRTSGLDHHEVTLAHAWAAAELELITRQRSSSKGLKPMARTAAQLLRTIGLRRQVAKHERRAAAAVAEKAAV